MSEPADADRRASASPPAASPPPEARRVGVQQVALRRAPRYRAFVLTGVFLGVAAAALLTVFFPDSGQFSAWALLGYLAVGLALVCGVLGALIALFVERPRGR